MWPETCVRDDVLRSGNARIRGCLVRVVKLEELLDNMKMTKGNVPSPGESVFLSI